MKKKGKSKRNKRISHLLEYLLIRSIWWAMGLLSEKGRITLVHGLLKFIYKRSSKYQKLLYNNISQSFPEKDSHWVNSVIDKTILNLARFVAEFMEVPRITSETIDKYMVPDRDRESILKEYDKGAVFVLGHMGNWEWHGSQYARFFPGRMFAVARRQSNPRTNRFFIQIREKGGAGTVFTDVNPVKFIKLARKGFLLALLADQDAGAHGDFVSFLNRPASTFRGPAVIARVTGLPLVFAYSYHQGDKLHTITQKVPEPNKDRVKDPYGWEMEITKNWVKLLEVAIRAHPEEYFWFHNRWKTQPESGTDKGDGQGR